MDFLRSRQELVRKKLQKPSICVAIMLLTSLGGLNCSPSGETNPPIAVPAKASHIDVSTEKRQTANDSPLRPVEQPSIDHKFRIHLKRDVKGKYSWEITGNNIKQILESDRQLRKKFGTSVQEDQP